MLSEIKSPTTFKMDGGTIAALIIGIIALVAVIVIIIIFFVDRQALFTNGVPSTVVQGATSDTSLVGRGGTIYVVANGVTANLAVTSPGGNPTGQTFTISNINNPNRLTIVGGSGVTLIVGSVPANGSGTFVWSNSTTVIQVS